MCEWVATGSHWLLADAGWDRVNMGISAGTFTSPHLLNPISTEDSVRTDLLPLSCQRTHALVKDHLDFLFLPLVFEATPEFGCSD